MKIVLTQTHKSWRFAANPLVLPNGLLYIAAYLEREGFEVKVIDPLPYDTSRDELVAQIKHTKPDLIGVYMTTDNRFKGLDLTNALKAEISVPIIAGGPHPTLCAEDTLQKFPGIDIVVRGEGEYSTLEIVKALDQGQKDLSAIPNVSFKMNNTIIHNPESYLIEDLDTIPFPAYHLVDMGKYKYDFPVAPDMTRKGMTLVASRGCPIGCIFCCSTHFWGRKLRSVSIERIFEQIELLASQYSVEHISFYDDTFNLTRKRVTQICHEFLTRKLGVTWDCSVRATNLDEEILRLMQEAGCRSICFGIESGNEDIRNHVVKKNVSQEKILELDAIAHKIGLDCNVNLMVSFPEETKEQAEDTFLLRKQLHAKAAISITKIYPGTAIGEIAREKGILKPQFTWMDPLAHKKYTPLYLPGLFSEIPLYKEKLSYIYIFEKLFEVTEKDWTFDKKKFGLFTLFKKYLSDINYWKDFIILSLIGISFATWHIKRFWHKITGRLTHENTAKN